MITFFGLFFDRQDRWSATGYNTRFRISFLNAKSRTLWHSTGRVDRSLSHYDRTDNANGVVCHKSTQATMPISVRIVNAIVNCFVIFVTFLCNHEKRSRCLGTEWSEQLSLHYVMFTLFYWIALNNCKSKSHLSFIIYC